MKTKLILIGLLIWNSISVLGQSCGTPNPINPTVYPQEDTNIQAKGSSSALCINVFFHIIRNTDGTSAFSEPNLDAIVSNLNQFYSVHNIIVNNLGSDFINNSSYINIDNNTEAINVGQVNNRNDAINYYIVETLWNVNGGFITGTANSIPSNNLVIRSDQVFTSTSPHELGHCLNLLHTHETSKGVEAINGSNCSTAGDLVCDTPADQGQGNVNGYNPDLTNLMSYYHNFGFTLDHFTNGQGFRVRKAIENESVLQNIISNSCTSISEVNNICYPQTKTVTLSNIGNSTTFWTSSSNVQIVSSNNSSAVIRGTNSNVTGNGWIRATINNGIVFQEDFQVGLPFGYSNWTIDIHPYPGNTQGGLFLNNWTRVWVLESPGGNWNWTANYSMIRNANSSQILIKPLSTGYLTIKARLENECGCGDWLSKNYYVTQLSGGGHHFREND